MDGLKVKILILKGVLVFIMYLFFYGEKIVFSNIESEIEVLIFYNGIDFDNVIGFLMIKIVYGEINVKFGILLKSFLLLILMYGLIDIIIFVVMKVNINMFIFYGEMFVDFLIKIDMEEKFDFVKYGGNKINGKINGGGLDLMFLLNYGNIYLCKK